MIEAHICMSRKLRKSWNCIESHSILEPKRKKWCVHFITWYRIGGFPCWTNLPNSFLTMYFCGNKIEQGIYNVETKTNSIQKMSMDNEYVM